MDSITCPSARAKPGSELLGVRQADGSVAILPQPLPVDEAFVAKANAVGTPPEQRFRFANKCVESGCQQWNGTGCSVANRVSEFLDKVPALTELPSCGIRHRCRWFLQKGKPACQICPYVLTEITEEEVLEKMNSQGEK